MSTHGAAFEILQQLHANRWQMLLSNHLLLEYQEVAKRYAAEMELTFTEIDAVLDALPLTPGPPSPATAAIPKGENSPNEFAR